MHTPASTKVLKKILGVKWALGGRIVGLNLLLTIPASRICQIFGASAASRVRQFQNHLGFRPRGRPRREMRQRCGVVSTSKAAPLAPDERHPLAAPPPASLSSAAASAACIDGSDTASVTIKCGRVSGLHRRLHRRQRRNQKRPRQRPASTAATPPASLSSAAASAACAPEAATPEAATPEAATPEAATPEAATPKAATPEAATPEAAHTESEGGGKARAGRAQCLGGKEKTRAGTLAPPFTGGGRRAGVTMGCGRCLPNWVR